MAINIVIGCETSFNLFHFISCQLFHVVLFKIIKYCFGFNRYKAYLPLAGQPMHMVSQLRAPCAISCRAYEGWLRAQV